MMFGQSNDWFYASDTDGVRLFNGKQPISGDLTSKVFLYDAGSEKDEEIGIGPNQGPRQKGVEHRRKREWRSAQGVRSSVWTE